MRLALFLCAGPLLADPSLILHHGKLWTGDPAKPWAQALAAENGVLAAVGTNEEVLKLRGPATRVIDLQGRLVIPGFNDAHTHFFGG